MLNYGIWRLFISKKINKMYIFLKINIYSNLCGFSNVNELKKMYILNKYK